MTRSYDARMKTRLRGWWNTPLKTWQLFAVVAASVLFWQIVKAAFPEQSQALADVITIPSIVVVVILAGWGIYRRWRGDFAQPPRRR